MEEEKKCKPLQKFSAKDFKKIKLEMKKFTKQFLFSLPFVALLNTSVSFVVAQDQSSKYLRSSLSMVLIETDSLPDREAIYSSWDNYPFPEKYNKHEIELKSFKGSDIELSDEYLLSLGFLRDTLRDPLEITKAIALMKPLKYLNDEKTVAVVLPNEKQQYRTKIEKVIKEKKLANQVVSTWFNQKDGGKFDMSLIQERGFYNASEIEAGIAKGQSRGIAALGDAGEELIKNTFVTFTKLEFIANEPVARLVRDIAKQRVMVKMGLMPTKLIEKAMRTIDTVYERTKEGYFLWSKTWLYQLNWNDSISRVFYTDYWNNPSAFSESDLFKLNFVGVQYNQSLVTFKMKEKRTREQVIDLVLVRNVNNAFSELQRDHKVFKPKVPILSVNPIVASIGKKESITPKSQFEVLEMVWDSKESKTTWKRVGKCKVDKSRPIWDNRYNAGQEVEPQKDDDGNVVTGTALKGSSKIQPGMLIRQIR